LQYATPNSKRIPYDFDLEPSAVDSEGLGYVFIKRVMINIKGLYLHNYYQVLQVLCTVENWWKMATKVNTENFTRM
jgi:hypothetical protein